MTVAAVVAAAAEVEEEGETVAETGIAGVAGGTMTATADEEEGAGMVPHTRLTAATTAIAIDEDAMMTIATIDTTDAKKCLFSEAAGEQQQGFWRGRWKRALAGKKAKKKQNERARFFYYHEKYT